MEFIHRAESHLDTIAAIATPPGEGGVAVIRISGRRAHILLYVSPGRYDFFWKSGDGSHQMAQGS